MKNWKELAEALQLGIPDADVARIAPALDTLDAAFAPLRQGIPGDVEPAVTFRAVEEPR